MVCGALFVLGIVLMIGVAIGVLIGREGSVKTPVGEVTVDGSATTTVTVRVSGTQGIRYDGAIGTTETGQKSIDGTLRDIPDDYELPLDTSPGSTDVLTARVGKHPVDNSKPGRLRLELLADGRAVREQESSSETGVVTLTYYATEAREEL